MKCDIIRDLIPVCIEGLCSEESVKEIQEHIKDCEKCRILYEKIPVVENVPPENMPDESKAFRKINKKIKKGKLKIIILSVLLIAVISAVSYLSYNQITKRSGTRSFETIIQTMEVKHIMNYLAEGDVEKYVDSVSKAEFDDYYMNDTIIQSIRESDIQKLNNAYDEFTKENPIESVKVSSYYEQNLNRDSIVYSDILIKTKNEELNFLAVKESDGKYKILNSFILFYEPWQENSAKFQNTLSYINNHSHINTNIISKLLCKNFNNSKKSPESTVKFIVCRFNTDCRENISENMIDFYNKGFTVENAFFSPFQIDTDKNMFFYNIAIIAKDSNGSAIMNTRIYYDEYGFLSPETDTIQIYSDNCSKDLENSLKIFFG